MRMIKLIAPLLLILMCAGLKAQTITDFKIKYESSELANGTDSLVKVVCVLTVSDTGDITHIHIKCGTESGGNDKFDHSFVFDSTTGLPTGTSYSRTGNTLSIVIGDYIYGDFFYEAKLENGLGVWSAVKSWNITGQ